MARLAALALLFAVLAPQSAVLAGASDPAAVPAVAADHHGHHAAHHHHDAHHGAEQPVPAAAADLQCHCPVVGCVPPVPVGALMVTPAFVAAGVPLPPSDAGLPLASVIPPHKPPRA